MHNMTDEKRAKAVSAWKSASSLPVDDNARDEVLEEVSDG
jgi:hypothetical protein